MSKLKLDLHEIYNKSDLIESVLQGAFDEVLEKRIKTLEIIPGKGSGQLKKKVLRFLSRPEIKSQIHRIERDSVNFGRILVYFKF